MIISGHSNKTEPVNFKSSTILPGMDFYILVDLRNFSQEQHKINIAEVWKRLGIDPTGMFFIGVGWMPMAYVFQHEFIEKPGILTSSWILILKIRKQEVQYINVNFSLHYVGIRNT